MKRDHGASRALVLGLLCMPIGILGPFAALAGWRSFQRVRASEGQLAGAEGALIGLASGLLTTSFLVVGIVWFVVAAHR